MSKNTFQSPKGTRDYFPELMSRLRWIFDRWRDVSLRHGFEEYDGPIFENLELFQLKSGEEIASQLFNFEDRGGRRLAIRPEITPSLARMVAEKAHSLRVPVKWFSTPRLCRAERPQRGRLREFFQWNIDIIGSDKILADAEGIFVAIDFLRQIGLGPDLVEVQVNSRTITSALLVDSKITAERHEHIFSIMDKYEKLPGETFANYAHEQGLTDTELSSVRNILELPDLDAARDLCRSQESRDELRKLNDLRDYLDAFGIGQYFKYKPSVVRGLAYYTGIVYEIFEKTSKLRAIAGGGRYDHLIKLFGGPELPATGFGMGDVVLLDLLEDLGKMPQITTHRAPEFFLIDAAEEFFPLALRITAALRKQKINAEYSPKRQSFGKQLKFANTRLAACVIIVDEETKANNTVSVKNLKTGQQTKINLDVFLEHPSKIYENKQSL